MRCAAALQTSTLNSISMASDPPTIFTAPSAGSPPSAPGAVFSAPSAGAGPSAPGAVFAAPSAGTSPSAPGAVFSAPSSPEELSAPTEVLPNIQIKPMPSAPRVVFTAPAANTNPSSSPAVFAGLPVEGSVIVSGITNPSAANGVYIPEGNSNDGYAIYKKTGTNYQITTGFYGGIPGTACWDIVFGTDSLVIRYFNSTTRPANPGLVTTWTNVDGSGGSGTAVVAENLPAGTTNTPPVVFTP